MPAPLPSPIRARARSMNSAVSIVMEDANGSSEAHVCAHHDRVLGLPRVARRSTRIPGCRVRGREARDLRMARSRAVVGLRARSGRRAGGASLLGGERRHRSGRIGRSRVECVVEHPVSPGPGARTARSVRRRAGFVRERRRAAPATSDAGRGDATPDRRRQAPGLAAVGARLAWIGRSSSPTPH